jgi:hypothetical protein
MKFHFFSLLLFLVVALMGALLVNTVTAGGGSLTVNPANTSALVGFTAVVDLDISGLSNVQGADVAVSFDETILQVVDADGVASGVQISGGDCPTPDFEALNDADNGSGTIEYAAVSTSGTCGSGSVASVQFLCVDTGTSPVTITSSEISDNNGFLIPHTTVDGQVTCSGATAIIFLPLVKRD